jgi:hypothetical protein
MQAHLHRGSRVRVTTDGPLTDSYRHGQTGTVVQVLTDSESGEAIHYCVKLDGSPADVVHTVFYPGELEPAEAG